MVRHLRIRALLCSFRPVGAGPRHQRHRRNLCSCHPVPQLARAGDGRSPGLGDDRLRRHCRADGLGHGPVARMGGGLCGHVLDPPRPGADRETAGHAGMPGHAEG